MGYLEQVNAFATKWVDKFRDQKISYTDLVDHYLADECEALGFQMDCGHSFSERYGKAESKYDELDKVIDEVNDIQLLGSAIYSRWRYFNHWAYDATSILEFENRSWFILALSRLAVLSGENPFIFKGKPKKVRIVSNRLGYGLCPEPDEEVEQHLTINSEGRVWYSVYVVGHRRDGHYEKSRTKNFKLEKRTAERVLEAVSDYFSEGYIEVFATDVGDWSLELTNTEGKIFKFRGSLCSEFEVQGEDLSELIRDSLGMPELYVFDGNYKPDIVNRIEVDYHRITQIMPKQSAVELDRVVWNYTESLVIDINQESIEQIQNIGTGCSVSHKYMVEDGIDSLLDDLDVDVLFGHIEGNPVDVVDDPNEIRDYTIKVITKKGKEKIIRGTYDKKGLPDGWEVFIDSVFEFMAFYGWGEIMDPSVYGRIRRCRSDIIFCSVTFEEGYKRYYYIADDDSIEVGDFVIVPAGKDNHEAVVEVVKKEYFSENEVPLPLDRTKHIIRKCTESDLNLPE